MVTLAVKMQRIRPIFSKESLFKIQPLRCFKCITLKFKLFSPTSEKPLRDVKLKRMVMLLSMTPLPLSQKNKSQSNPKRRRRHLLPKSLNIKKLNLKSKSRVMMVKCINILKTTKKKMKVEILTIAHRQLKNPQKNLQKLSLRYRVKRLLKC